MIAAARWSRKTGLDLAWLGFAALKLTALELAVLELAALELVVRLYSVPCVALTSYLNECGISEELQRKLLDSDPRLRQVRDTGTAEYWLIDTFEMRYNGLVSVQDESRERQRRLDAEGGNSPRSNYDRSNTKHLWSTGS
jgi:hypothetical protein